MASPHYFDAFDAFRYSTSAIQPATKFSPDYYIIDLVGGGVSCNVMGKPRVFPSRSQAETEAKALAGKTANTTARYVVVKSVVEIETKRTTSTNTKEFH